MEGILSKDKNRIELGLIGIKKWNLITDILILDAFSDALEKQTIFPGIEEYTHEPLVYMGKIENLNENYKLNKKILALLKEKKLEDNILQISLEHKRLADELVEQLEEIKEKTIEELKLRIDYKDLEKIEDVILYIRIIINEKEFLTYKYIKEF